MRRASDIRRIGIQALATLAQNPYLSNFFTSNIYKGNSKQLCVPGLNCYSCPAALGACPIGALQAVECSVKYDVAFYVLGLLVIFGAVAGRFICGFLCPFGFLQDLLFATPVRKRSISPSIDRPLRKLKYFILLIFVIVLPLIMTNSYGTSAPFFCKYICPAGTIEAGIPAVIKNSTIRSMIGGLFSWKLALAVGILFSAVLVARPFCKYLCPLGAFYSLFNRVSIVQLQVASDRCTACRRCEQQCPMQVDILTNINSAECIRCGRCRHHCKENAIQWQINSIRSHTND